MSGMSTRISVTGGATRVSALRISAEGRPAGSIPSTFISTGHVAGAAEVAGSVGM
jgi:hypothetical protein